MSMQKQRYFREMHDPDERQRLLEKEEGNL